MYIGSDTFKSVCGQSGSIVNCAMKKTPPNNLQRINDRSLSICNAYLQVFQKFRLGFHFRGQTSTTITTPQPTTTTSTTTQPTTTTKRTTTQPTTTSTTTQPTTTTKRTTSVATTAAHAGSGNQSASHTENGNNATASNWTKEPLWEWEATSTVNTEGDKETTVTVNITKADGVEVNRTIETTVKEHGQVTGHDVKVCR